MKILVTGGAGFIGSHIVDALIVRGHRVIVIDNLSTGFEKNVHPKAQLYPYDIRAKAVRRVFQKERPDVVIHHAAQMNVRYSVEHPADDADINILGTINLFDCCRQYNIKTVVFASSGGAIYGDTQQLPTPESAPLLPASPYGIAKLAGEHYLRYTATQSSMRWIALRYGNVYGPRQNALGEAGVVAIFTNQLLKGKTPVINGTGKQMRDFVFIDDVIQANLLALGSRRNGVVNIGTGIETDVNHLFEDIRAAMDSQIRAGHGPAKAGEQVRSCLDNNLAKKILRWKPTISLQEGIKRTVEWFRQENSQ